MKKVAIITLFAQPLITPIAFASSGGGGGGFGILLGIILVIAIPILIFTNSAQKARQNELVKDGKATYFVKISATGRVYHSLSCGKCRTGYKLTEKEAREKGYSPCATCGGAGKFEILS
jgi:hypothetical protein